MHPKLCRAERLALGFALLVAVGCFVHQWWYPSTLFDAGQYTEMGHSIADHGPFSRFMESQVRTYGYPLFLSAIYVIAGTLHLPSILLLFLAQLGLYLMATVLLRRSVAWFSVPASRVVFCGLMFNYYALLYTPECLTESLSLSALILLGAGWLECYRYQAPLSLLAVLSLVAGFSILIRPANASIAIVWLTGVGLIGFRNRFTKRRAVATVAVVCVSLALPFIPQLTYNGLQFGRWTPLLARNLGRRQQAWGIQDIKYATAMPPSPEAGIHYVNPWVQGTTLDVEAPLKWYAANPGRGALTLAVHTFNLTDQDLLFTYSRDLDPWYRVPLGIINHAVVVLGLIGLVLGASKIRHAGSQIMKDAFSLMVMVLVGVWAMHVWTAVEMRFGLALFCVLFPAAAYTLRSLAGSAGARTIAGTAIVVALYVVGALKLSAWVRDQSPVIHAVVSQRRQADASGAYDGRDATRVNRSFNRRNRRS
jgi:hypothetical protein